ncbi:hypothetical protein Tco_1193605 [Tanacetum coccineum]
MEKTQILKRLYGVTPKIVLRRNIFKHYGVTWTLDYAVTSFKPARWKVDVGSLWCKPLKDLRSDQGLHSLKNSKRRPREITLNLLLYLIVHKQLLNYGGIDINTLTMEQYLELLRETQAPGVVKPEIGGNVNFEIKSQFMRELREDTFLRNKNEDAHDHVDRVLYIELSTLGTSLKRPLSKGPIPGMKPTQALTVILIMADHSQKWHDGKSSRNVSSSSDTNRLTTVIRPHLDKECPLNEEVKQVDEVKYGEFGLPAPFNGSSGAKFRVGPPGYYTRTDNQTPSGEKNQTWSKQLISIWKELPKDNQNRMNG